MYPHSPRASEALNRIVDMIHDEISSWIHGDIRDHAYHEARTNTYIWNGDRAWHFEPDVVYVAWCRKYGAIHGTMPQI